MQLLLCNDARLATLRLLSRTHIALLRLYLAFNHLYSRGVAIDPLRDAADKHETGCFVARV